MFWQTSRRKLSLERTLVMGILNVTPDSFFDGGRYNSADAAIRHGEQMLEQGADIIDVGGESTRPGSASVKADEEIRRVVPVIEAVAKRFDFPISIDTTKSDVARAAIDAGAEIINDISGLRFDSEIADLAAERQTGLVLMHSRGTYETMHSQTPVEDVIDDVIRGLRSSIDVASSRGVTAEQIVLDPGIGFGKSLEQNLELIGSLDQLQREFPGFGFLVGASRKSFIGKILDVPAPDDRLTGSMAAAAIAVWNGALIVRTHDVAETRETIKVVNVIRRQSIKNRSEPARGNS